MTSRSPPDAQLNYINKNMWQALSTAWARAGGVAEERAAGF